MAFLPPGLLALQKDPTGNPVTLWTEQGNSLWQDAQARTSCQGCHGAISSVKLAATHFPRLAPDGRTLINLEDQIVICRQRAGHPQARLEDDEVLALSAALNAAATGLPIAVHPPPEQEAAQRSAWQAQLARGAQRFATRMGRMNLACVHCHDMNIGRQLLSEVISPGHPTGFPVYRMSWQKPGSIDRRLRACYSGVQAKPPLPGDPALRQLELYLKVRANGLPLDGPSIRR
jgi:sulfur-oxidizing protein SoxA